MELLRLTEFYKWGKTIIAIGRNYAAHAKELGNEVPSKPFYFLKPSSSYLAADLKQPIEIPRELVDANSAVHHELELGVVVGHRCKRLASASEAMAAVAGYTLALDLTARDVQSEAKKQGRPWSQAKGYDCFTPVGPFIAADRVADPGRLGLELRVNGEVRQSGTTADMIHSVPDLLMFVSSIMTLNRGDVLLTGTPAGVGPLAPGDQVAGKLLDLSANSDLLSEIHFKVIKEQ